MAVVFWGIIRYAAVLCAGTASCYLAALASTLVWESPRLLVASLTDAEVHGFGIRGLMPRVFVLPPTEGSLLAFGLYAAGSLPIAALILLVGPTVLRKLRGWGRLLGAFLLFWVSIWMLQSVVAFLGWGRGSLAAVMRVFGTADFGAPVVPAVAALGCGGLVLSVLYRSVRELHSDLGESPLKHFGQLALWFVGPVVLLSLFAQSPVMGWWLRRLGLEFGPAFLSLAIGVLVAWRPGGSSYPLRPGLAGAAGTLLAGAFALAGMSNYPSVVERFRIVEWDTLRSRHWRLSFEEGALSPPERASYAAAADRRIEDIAERLAINLDKDSWQAYVHLFSNGRRGAGRGAAYDDPISIEGERPALHQFLTPSGNASDPRGEALLLLSSRWGEPGSAAVARAVARYAIGDFHGHELAAHARRVACEERPYTLREILRVENDYLSPLVRDALGGAWIDSLVPERGQDLLRRLYEAPLEAGGEKLFSNALGRSWERMEDDWHRFLREDAGCLSSSMAAGAEDSELDLDHRGISFSHEYGGGWGYGSEVAERQLKTIRKLGANTIAIVPYAFTRAPSSTWIRFRTDETDARVIRTIERAHQLGLRTMLKPHLWTGRFTGDIAFERREDFQVWFSQYRRWLLHFARLAELHGVELLALGNELGGLTPHEEAWRELIRDVRRVYRGPLTYAANWDKEFEQVSFWDDLDYLGVNFYYPLAENGETPRASSPRMRRLLEQIRSVSQKFGKPVLFTEVGYPSVRTAATEPWRETDAALDLELQRHCYQAVFESVSGHRWFAGMYWWKWPTHGRGGPYDASYSPVGKPALGVIRQWYGGGALGSRHWTD